MRLKCKDLKRIVGNIDNRFVYKGHNSLTGQPETRIDMSKLDKDKRVEIKCTLWKFGLSLYQDDPLHNPFDYVVTY